MNISPNQQSSSARAPFPSLLRCAPQKQDKHILSSSALSFCHSHSKAKDSNIRPRIHTVNTKPQKYFQLLLPNSFERFDFQKNSTFPLFSINLVSFQGTAGKSNTASELQLCQCPPPSPWPTPYSCYSRIKTDFIKCLENISKNKRKNPQQTTTTIIIIIIIML